MALPNISRLSRLTAPAFKLSVDGSLSSPTLNERLVSISVTLNNGEVSDQLSLEFDDRPTLFGSGIGLPTLGVVISASLGYETYLTEMGEFTVNQVSLNGSSGGRTLSVSATPALLNTDVTRTWGDLTIGEIVDAIAREYKLTAKVSPTLKREAIGVINQLNESDSAFLSRLAERYNAVYKPMAGNLLFMAKGEGTSASGFPMLPVDIPPQDVIQWSKNVSEQQDFKKVCAYWYDYINAADREVYVPPGTPKPRDSVLRLPHLYNSESEAASAANAKFDEVNRGDQSLSLTMMGNPEITAEGRISLNNLRSSVDGDYIVKSAVHSFSQSGYQTRIQAYVEP